MASPAKPDRRSRFRQAEKPKPKKAPAKKAAAKGKAR